MKGTCEEFCPEEEAKMRIKENLLHFFELKNGLKREPGILVKEFARSAAGRKTLKSKDLRTEICLQRTIDYLLKVVILDKRKPYNYVYDFIFDRLRSVRQEMVMQNYNSQQSIKCLEPIIMFLVYSRYRLCNEPISYFDPKICDQHLQECICCVLCCYDEVMHKDLNLRYLKNRCFIESIYQLFNLGYSEALKRAISLPPEIRRSNEFALSFRIALSYYQGNIYRVFNRMEQLPHILCATLSIKLPTLRRHLVLVFAHAYSNKQLKVPLQFLASLCHSDANIFLAECKHYGVKSDDGKNVTLIKSDFILSAPTLSPGHEQFVEEKFKNLYLPDMLLLKKL